MTDQIQRVTKPCIWAIFRHYNPNFAGGAIQAIPLLKGLQGQGFTINVLTAADHLAVSLSGQQLEVDGIPVYYVPLIQRREWYTLEKLPRARKLLLYLNNLLGLYTFNHNIANLIYQVGQPGDILQLFSANQFSYLALQAAHKRQMRACIQLTLLGSDDPGSFRPGPGRSLKMKVFRAADKVIGISSVLTDSCRTAGIPEDKIVKIPNGVDTRLFRPLAAVERGAVRQQMGWAMDKRYILFVGAALQRKGIDVLLKAYMQIAEQIKDVDLIVIGPNDFNDHSRYPTAFQQLVDELRWELEEAGLAGRVHWLGFVDQDLQRYFQASDLFCFPTRREGLPNVVTMALASGLPVIAARLEGITTDLIQSTDEGVLIEGHDPQDYAQALLQLLNNPEHTRRIAQTALVRVQKTLDQQVIVERYAQLYRELGETPYA